jgi:hypothetical protein
MFDEPGLTIHKRIVKELESNVVSREWWLWISFQLEEEGVDPDVRGIGAEVEAWLDTMNVDVPVEQAYKLPISSGAAISVEVAAVPRPLGLRGRTDAHRQPVARGGFLPRRVGVERHVVRPLCGFRSLPAERSKVGSELALRLERLAEARKPPKAPLARSRSGAEANSALCGASTLSGNGPSSARPD